MPRVENEEEKKEDPNVVLEEYGDLDIQDPERVQSVDELSNMYQNFKMACSKLRWAIGKLGEPDKPKSKKGKKPVQPDLPVKKKSEGRGIRAQASPRTDFQVRTTLRGHFGKIYAMQWASKRTGTSGTDNSDHNLVSASQDGNLMIWSGTTSNKKSLISLRSSWVMTCAYAPNRDRVACGGLDNMCSIYSTKNSDFSGQSIPLMELQEHEGYLSCCRFIDNNSILTSSGDSTILLWDLNAKTTQRQFLDHSGDVMSISINPTDPHVFVSGSCDTTAKIFDTRQEKATGTFMGHWADINAVQWFPDGLAFVSGSDDSSMILFDRRAYKQMNIYKDDFAICGITSCSFSKNGKYLFAGYDSAPNAMVWNTLDAVITQKLEGLSARVSCVGVQCDGQALCTGSWDNLLRIWA